MVLKVTNYNSSCEHLHIQTWHAIAILLKPCNCLDRWTITKKWHSHLQILLFPCRYMKYLYPYECEKRGLSSPSELQAAIDSNRREGRRQSYGSAIFNYSPVSTPTVLSSQKMQMPHLPMPTHSSGHISQVAVIKKGKKRHLLTNLCEI